MELYNKEIQVVISNFEAVIGILLKKIAKTVVFWENM